jgi:hypothetical protein
MKKGQCKMKIVQGKIVQGELALTYPCNISAANFEKKEARQLQEISPVQGDLALTHPCSNSSHEIEKNQSQ